MNPPVSSTFEITRQVPSLFKIRRRKNLGVLSTLNRRFNPAEMRGHNGRMSPDFQRSTGDMTLATQYLCISEIQSGKSTDFHPLS